MSRADTTGIAVFSRQAGGATGIFRHDSTMVIRLRPGGDSILNHLYHDLTSSSKTSQGAALRSSDLGNSNRRLSAGSSGTGTRKCQHSGPARARLVLPVVQGLRPGLLTPQQLCSWARCQGPSIQPGHQKAKWQGPKAPPPPLVPETGSGSF